MPESKPLTLFSIDVHLQTTYQTRNRSFILLFLPKQLVMTPLAVSDDTTTVDKGLSEFYGDLVYKFNKIEGTADFSDQFRKIIVRYKRIG